MDPISAIASIITIVDSISSIYNAVRDVQGLPKAFDEVAQNLPLVKETLDLAYRQAQSHELNESDKDAIRPVVDGCRVKVEALSKIFKEIKHRKDQSQDAKDWSTLSKFYHKIVVPMGKASRVEVLMRNMMDQLKVLAVHQMFRTATHCQTERLQEAIEKLAKVEPSLPDSAFETGNGSINMNIYDQGNGFVNQSGSQENVMGNKFDAKGNMNFAAYHVYGSTSQRNNILEWLESISSPFHFDKKLHDLLQIARKSPSTGDWFLRSLEFIDWRDGNLRKLWCYGQVGAGKSVLTSTVINHLQTLRNRYYGGQNVACIYVFFDYREHQKQTLINILSTLLVQLLRDSQTVAEEVRETFEACAQKRLFLGQEEYLQLLESQARNFRRIYMVIDGLDECSNDINGNTLNEFLDVCRGLPESFHMLFTSIPGLKSQVFNPDGRIEITARPEDIRMYCGNFIGARPQMLAIIDEGLNADPSFEESIFVTIVEKSHGVFLLAHLHMQNLASTQTLQEFRTSLTNLSSSQAEVYQKALRRISQQPEKQHRKAMSTLTWIVFAKRPLTIQEAAQALSIEHNLSYNNSRLVEVPKASITGETEWNLTSACAGMIVTVSDEGRISLHLTHSSAEECLRNSLVAQFQDAQSVLTKTCLHCLLNTPIEAISVRSSHTLVNSDIREAYPFYYYAANHWGQHLSGCVKGDVNQLAWEFLSNKEKLNCAVQAMDDLNVRRETDISGLHLAIYFGLIGLVRKAMRKNMPLNINHRSARGETPLHWAVAHRQREFVKFLADHHAELNVQNVDRRTPLHLAVINDDSTSVSLLLKTERADLELQDCEGLTPLRIAATKGKPRLMEMLLKAGAKVNAEGEGGWTALRSAVHQPCNMKMTIKLLIRHGASVSQPTKDGWTLLSFAAQEGREDIITLLVEMGISLDAADADGMTALRWSIDYKCSMVTWLLIHAKADVNVRDKNGVSPLHAAAKACHESNRSKNILWLLLDNGADVNARTRKYDETPLHMAATGGNECATWLLLSKGADPSQLDFNQRTALHCAVEGGHVEVARLLLWKRPDLINAVDQEKRNALHYAACQGDQGLAEMLVGCGADINAHDTGGKTPLHIAVLQSNEDVAIFLIRTGAKLDIPCRQNRGLVTLEKLGCSEAIMQAIDEARDNGRPQYRTSSV